MPFILTDDDGGVAAPPRAKLSNLSSTAGQPSTDEGGFHFTPGVEDSHHDDGGFHFTPGDPAVDEPLSNDQLREQFEKEYSKGIGEKAKDFVGNAWDAAVGFFRKPAVEAPQELGEASAQPDFGKRALATWTHGKASGVQGLADFVTGIPEAVVANTIDRFNLKSGDPAQQAVLRAGRAILPKVAAPLLNPEQQAALQAAIDKQVEQEKERAWQEYQLHYFKKRADAANEPTALANAVATIAEPFSNAAQPFVDPNMGNPNEAQPLPVTSDVVSTGIQLAVPGAALKAVPRIAQAVGAVASAAGAGKVAVAASKAAQKVGGAAEAAGALPGTLAKKAVTSLLGEKAGEAAAHGVEGAGLASLPGAIAEHATEAGREIAKELPGVSTGMKILAAAKGVKWGGAATRELGELGEALASAPADSIWGRMRAVATDPDSPEWMKALLNNKMVKVGAEAANIGVQTAKTAAGGAALGAGYAAATGGDLKDIAEATGAGAAMGTAAHVAHIPGTRNRAILERAAQASANLLKSHAIDGIPPEALKKVPAEAWTMAAAVNQMMGVNGRIRFVDGQTYANLKDAKGNPITVPGTDGVWHSDSGTVFINTDGVRNLNDVVLHEVAHPIFDDAVNRQPDIAATVDKQLQASGKNIDAMKRAYVEQLLAPVLASVTDGATREAAITSKIQEMDSIRPNWIYSEALAESFVNNLKASDVLGLDKTAAQVVKPYIKAIFGAKEGEATGLFTDFSNVIKSPELAKLSRDLMRAGREGEVEHGESLGGEAQGVAVTPDMVGKHPAANEGDLFVATPQGIKAAAPSAIRKKVRDRIKAVRSLFNTDVAPAPAGDTSPEVKLRKTLNGTEISGTKLPEAFYQLPFISDRTKAIARFWEKAIEERGKVGGWNNQVGTTRGGEDWHKNVESTHGNIQAFWNEGMPKDIVVTSKGHVLLRSYDSRALEARVAKWAKEHGERSLDLWGGDVNEFYNDVRTYLDNHDAGRPGATGIGPEKRNVINAAILGGRVADAGVNPLRLEMKGKERQGIIRSYRLDRQETADQMPTSFKQPNYNKLVSNFSPSTEIDGLLNSTPEEFRDAMQAYEGPHGAGQTGWSYTLGSQITTQAELQHLRDARQKAVEQMRDFRAKGDLNSALAASVKAQAVSEAYQAATGETFDGLPSPAGQVIEQYTGQPHVPPMAAKVEPESMAEAVVDQAGSERLNPQFSPTPDALKKIKDSLLKMSREKLEEVYKEVYYDSDVDLDEMSHAEMVQELMHLGDDADLKEAIKSNSPESGPKISSLPAPTKPRVGGVYRDKSYKFLAEKLNPLMADITIDRLAKTMAEDPRITKAMDEIFSNLGEIQTHEVRLKHYLNDLSRSRDFQKGTSGAVSKYERQVWDILKRIAPDDIQAIRDAREAEHEDPVQRAKGIAAGELVKYGFDGRGADQIVSDPQQYTDVRDQLPKGLQQFIEKHIHTSLLEPEKIIPASGNPADLIEMWTRYGESAEAIAQRLNGEGYTTSKGTSWTKEAVKEFRRTGQFSPAPKKGKALEHAVDEPLTLIHFSDKGSHLKAIDPKFMNLSRVGKYWEPKPQRSFFFVEGSALNERATKFADRDTYVTQVDGKKIYDATGDDPLGFFANWPNSGSAEKKIMAAGYDGVLITANGGADKVVISYKPVKVEHKGVTDSEGNMPQFSPSVGTGPASEGVKKSVDNSEEKGDNHGMLVVDHGNVIAQALDKARSKKNASPGITYDPRTGKAATSGFAVSLFPELSGQVNKADAATINSWSSRPDVAAALQIPGTNIGVWDDTKGDSGKVWLDVSAVFPDLESASYAGTRFNQKAIFDLKKLKEIPTGGTGDAVQGLPPIPERIASVEQEMNAEKEAQGKQISGPVTVTVPKDAKLGRKRQSSEIMALNANHVLGSFDMADFLSKTVEQFREQPGFENVSKDPKKAFPQILERLESNIEFLFDQATPEHKALWRQWYDFANTMSEDWAKEYGLDMHTVAAINARLSPQMDWYRNVTLTRRVLDTLKQDPTFTELDRLFLKAKFEKIQSAKDRDYWQGELNGIKDGQKMSTMTDAQAGMFLRSTNELKGSIDTHDHLLQPIPGGKTGWAKSFKELRGVVSIYRNPTLETVSRELGNNHKVRSFYNNHVAPESPLWSTIDTHAVAAANLYPYGGSDKAVKTNFGQIKHKGSGYSGTYWLYQKAYENVADKLGLLPREVQSIVWEQMRAELSPEAKRGIQKSEADQKLLKSIHKDMATGKISRAEGQQKIVDFFRKKSKADTKAQSEFDLDNYNEPDSEEESE